MTDILRYFGIFDGYFRQDGQYYLGLVVILQKQFEKLWAALMAKMAKQQWQEENQQQSDESEEVPPCQLILWLAPGVSNEGGSSPLLVPLPAVSWPWIPAWVSLEPPRDGENAQKTGGNGAKMGEIRPKKCEQGKDGKDHLDPAPTARLGPWPSAVGLNVPGPACRRRNEARRSE